MAQSNLGNTLYQMGRLDESIASYRKTLALDPGLAQAYTGLFFSLSHHEGTRADELFAEHRRFGLQFEPSLATGATSHANSRDPDRQIRVGFVSADLRLHPVASFVEPLLAHLAAFPTLSLHAYYNFAFEDAVTQGLRCYFKHWTPVAPFSDDALAARIREDGIDILIDLSGHTAGNRLLTFARKPAPIQASWIGYPGASGLGGMDYYLADEHFLPAATFGRYFTEKLVSLPALAPFLPDTFAPPVSDLPALRNGHVTFGSFNRLSKLQPAVVTLWSKLLRALPGARCSSQNAPRRSV